MTVRLEHDKTHFSYPLFPYLREIILCEQAAINDFESLALHFWCKCSNS